MTSGTKQLEVYVVVVTHNAERWLDKCFGSLSESSIPLKIIVVDNASTDDTVVQIQTRYPLVELIKSGENLGFGRGNNLGIRKALAADADYLFLLNQDAWVQRDSVEKMVALAEKYRGFGVISPVHLSGDGAAFEYKFEEYIQSTVCPGFVRDLYFQTPREVYETTFVNAAAWIIPASVFKRVGFFDPLFPHYGEDVDFVQRVQFQGMKVGISPNTSVFHDSRMQPWSEIMWNKNRMLTIYLSEVKNINGSLRSNLLVFLKRRFDELTGHLLYRQFRLFLFRLRLVSVTVRQLGRIRRARKQTLSPSAFAEK